MWGSVARGTVTYERLQGALKAAGKPHEPHVVYEGRRCRHTSYHGGIGDV